MMMVGSCGTWSQQLERTSAIRDKRPKRHVENVITRPYVLHKPVLPGWSGRYGRSVRTTRR